MRNISVDGKDFEKGSGFESPSPPVYGDSHATKPGIGRRMIDSFKRDPNQTATTPGTVGADGKVFDVENAAAATAESPLARKLKGRHLQMIAIGGSIGMSALEASLTGSMTYSSH